MNDRITKRRRCRHLRRCRVIRRQLLLLVKELLDDGFTLDAAARKVEERMKTINDAFARLSGNKEQGE